jgi:murein L,D-transpeptidase YafK
MRPLLLSLIFLVSQAAWAEPAITLVRVIKNDHTLQLLSGEKLIREFHVVFGKNPKGHKMQEGDEKTPEGRYTLDYKKADSTFHRAIHISYPNAQDIAAAKARGIKPGGQIMIHGQKNGLAWLSFVSQRFNWTNGCIALSNEDMDIMWSLVREGTPIEILP